MDARARVRFLARTDGHGMDDRVIINCPSSSARWLLTGGERGACICARLEDYRSVRPPKPQGARGDDGDQPPVIPHCAVACWRCAADTYQSEGEERSKPLKTAPRSPPSGPPSSRARTRSRQPMAAHKTAQTSFTRGWSTIRKDDTKSPLCCTIRKDDTIDQFSGG
jgi:hypothetical protein